VADTAAETIRRVAFEQEAGQCFWRHFDPLY
jgi:hypothetical protein